MSKRSRRKKIPTDAMTATVESLNHEGRGVAHINGKTTFLFGGLPGETVSFRYAHCHGKYDEGTVIEVITPSDHRVTPKCAHFGTCGGCALQHLSVAAQRAHKEKVLLEHLQHQAQCTSVNIAEPLFAASFGYRRRARLSARYVIKKEKVLVGFRERQSHYIAELTQCETLHPSVGLQLNALGELLSSLIIKTDIPQIEVAIGDNATAVIVRHMVTMPNADQEKLIAFAKKNHWQLYFQPSTTDSIHPVFPNNPEKLFYDLKAQNIRVYFKPAHFTQINAEINAQMVTRAIDWLDLQKTDRVLDLFCGIGNFSLSMARNCKTVVGIEGSDAAITQAKENAIENHLTNTAFYTHDLTKTSKDPWYQASYDKILLDPPRAGALELLENMAIWQPKRIVYVSCNPITLGRDTKYLLQLGYQLEKAGVMDMFPHTEHIEAIALFQRPTLDK